MSAVTVDRPTPAVGAVVAQRRRAIAVGPQGPPLPVRPTQSRAVKRAGVTRRVSRALSRVLLMALFLLPLGGAAFVSAAPRAAAWGLGDLQCKVVDDYWNWSPEKPGAGVESMMPPDKDASYTNKGTMLDRYGVRGMQFSGTVWQKQSDIIAGDYAHQLPEKHCSVMNQTMNMGAGLVFDTSRFIMGSTIGIQQRATDSGMLLAIMHNIGSGKLYDSLRNQLFFPALALSIMLTGIWVIGKNARGQTREIREGVIWAFGSALVAIWLALPTKHSAPYVEVGKDPNFMWVTSSVNKASDDFIGAFANTIPQQSTPECITGGGSNEGRRVANCQLWNATLYRPWITAMWDPSVAMKVSYPFSTPKVTGDLKTHNSQALEKKDMRQITLDSLAYSYGQYYYQPKKAGNAPSPRPALTLTNGQVSENTSEFKGEAVPTACSWLAATWGESPATDPKVPTVGESGKVEQNFEGCTKHGEFNLVRAKMVNGPDAQWLASWTGQRPVDRFTQALTSLFASLLVGVLYVFTSVLTMMWHAVPIVLMLALPIVALAGVYPPTRQVLKNLMQEWVKASLLAFALGMVQILAVVIVAGIMVTGLPGGTEALADGGQYGGVQMSIGWKCLLLVVMVAGLMHLVKKIRQDKFTPNVGGSVEASGALDKGLAKFGVGAMGAGTMMNRRRQNVRNQQVAAGVRRPPRTTGQRVTAAQQGAARRTSALAGGAAGAAAGLAGAVTAGSKERKARSAGAGDPTLERSKVSRFGSMSKSAAGAVAGGVVAGARGGAGKGVKDAYATGSTKTRAQRLAQQADNQRDVARRRNAARDQRAGARAMQGEEIATRLDRADATMRDRSQGLNRRRGLNRETLSDPRAAFARKPSPGEAQARANAGQSRWDRLSEAERRQERRLAESGKPTSAYAQSKFGPNASNRTRPASGSSSRGNPAQASGGKPSQGRRLTAAGGNPAQPRRQQPAGGPARQPSGNGGAARQPRQPSGDGGAARQPRQAPSGGGNQAKQPRAKGNPAQQGGNPAQGGRRTGAATPRSGPRRPR